MELHTNIETADSVKAKALTALGFDLSSALDLVSRRDYDSDEAYLDAATKAELERSNPEYRSIRSRLKAELRQRTEQEERKAQGEAYKAIRASVSLDSVDQKNIDTEPPIVHPSRFDAVRAWLDVHIWANGADEFPLLRWVQRLSSTPVI